MGWHLERFREIMENRGLLTAISATYFYIERSLHKKTGLDDFILNRLAVGGPPTISHALYVKLYKPIVERKIGSGNDVMDEDWDNLLLLDSYRADYFREYSSFEGDLSTVVSKGNVSAEFVAKNFQEEYHDTIVITSNPWYHQRPNIDESTFYTLINPVGMENRKSNPEQITEAALDAIEEYPDKRVIVHYMQPHTPHMGETADRLREDIGYESYPGIFTLYRRGVISKEELKQSYLETIRFIEDEIQELLEKLDGKTVVSSDHGENLGEIQHGMMQLRHGNPTPECRYVPWLEMSYDERREITEDPPIGFDALDEQSVEERLVTLGYK